jgi:hypothetical protein
MKNKKNDSKKTREGHQKTRKVDELLTWAQFQHLGPDHDFLTLKHQRENMKFDWE